MAPTLDTPGVYVAELPATPPGGQDVPTSITAFVGRTVMGPVDEPVTLNSFGDYQRVFGPLAADHPLSYAVSAFFNNGGAQAVVVRLYEAPGGAADTATIALSPGDLVLTAAAPGSWGNALSASIDTQGINALVGEATGVADLADLFNLTITLALPGRPVVTERFLHVTLNAAYPQLLLGHVLAAQSQYVRFAGGVAAPPAGALGTGAGGRDSASLSMTTYLGDQDRKTGLYALERTPVFNILCIPPDQDGTDTPPLVYQTAAAYCVGRLAMLIIDPPAAWQADFDTGAAGAISMDALTGFGLEEARNCAVYFPRVLAADPLDNGQIRSFPPSGYIAGIWAQTDTARGVWKAPAGTTTALNGVAGLAAILTDSENGLLNPQGINCLRQFPTYGPIVWGARTMAGADQLADDYKYVSVRRLTLYVQAWLSQNIRWAVFQPNNETLWSALRQQADGFMSGLFRQGAFVGSSASQAYFVVCDATTTTADDIDRGIVNLLVGFAPVKPAEFVILTIQQIAMAPT